MSVRRLRLLSPVPRHSEQLQISKDSRKVEEELNIKLVSLITQLQKLQKEGNLSFFDLDFRQRIDSTIRGGIEQIYKIAASYAAEFSSRDYFTTRTDLDTIDRLTYTYVSLFFSRLQRFIINVNPEEKVRLDFIVNMTTATMTQDVMRQAIITKSQQVINPVTITTSAEGDQQIVYVWVTSQDDKVCPNCSSYEGQAWPYDDSGSIPSIPDDTHPNCRCMVQLAEAEFL